MRMTFPLFRICLSLNTWQAMGESNWAGLRPAAMEELVRSPCVIRATMGAIGPRGVSNGQPMKSYADIKPPSPQVPLAHARWVGFNDGPAAMCRLDKEAHLMRTAIVIPARYGSSRLPGKPLLRSTGKYLVQHVYERALGSRRARYVIIATDDSRIAAAVESFGGNYVMTRSDHASGTDRVAEVAEHLDVDIIINLQGDEPEVDVAALDLLPDLLEDDEQASMATVATPIRTRQQWLDAHCVKVVCDHDGRALYFSRSPIPSVRDGEPDFSLRPSPFLQHVGLYAYHREFLLQLAQTPPTPLEKIEKLEQLRALALGCKIRVGLVANSSCGVDTLSDYQEFVRRYREKSYCQAA